MIVALIQELKKTRATRSGESDAIAATAPRASGGRVRASRGGQNS